MKILVYGECTEPPQLLYASQVAVCAIFMKLLARFYSSTVWFVPPIALPVSQILWLQQIEKLGEEQFSCFSDNIEEKMETD